MVTLDEDDKTKMKLIYTIWFCILKCIRILLTDNSLIDFLAHVIAIQYTNEIRLKNLRSVNAV